ncbi:hypothetical protein XcvCFBP7113P_01365 [Xanthomonas citri pv. vignicola]|nr:hypothetical protein XcvCFBP7113P_01365 [Xanthomonas citri pv. vignicola]
MPRVSVSVSAAAVISLRHRPPRPLGLKTAYAIIDDRPICSGTLVPNSPRHAHSVHSHDRQRYSEKPSNTGS